MHIGDFNSVRSSSQVSFPHSHQTPRLTNELASSRPNFEAQVGQTDLAEDIKNAINASYVHKLFSALSRSASRLFKNYNRNIDDLQAPQPDLKAVDFGDSLSFSVSQLDSFDLSANITSPNFSTGISISQFLTTDVDFTVSNNGIKFSASQTSVQSFSLVVDVQEEQQADPLILDLDFNGFSFSSNSKNIEFDLNADGRLDSISRPSGQDAFLAIDLNGNGQIDNGLELFGDSSGSKDGFADLKRFDLNNDAVIDAQDRVYDQLLLLSFTGKGEQQINRLSEQDVKSISLDANQQKTEYGDNNELVSVASFEINQGEQGMIGDFLLGIGNQVK